MYRDPVYVAHTIHRGAGAIPIGTDRADLAGGGGICLGDASDMIKPA
jgi:hypothetical protein